ncbi:putative two-component system sensor kinase [Streptomyces malaysiensis subsp. malaysiensis]|nr:putative two-component system sensor kinase [Streptomyces malaysiensis]
MASGTAWLPAVATGPLIALAVLETPWSPSLDTCVAAVVSLSLALTAWSLIAPSTMAWWGVLETLGLLCMGLRTTAQSGRTAAAAAETVLISATVLLLPLRTGSWEAFTAGGYVLTVALAIFITLGYTIRALEARRERTAREVRHGERLALARDLHDLIAHHMTGIIVQANAALSIQAAAPDKIEPILRNIARSGAETLESTRRLVRVLREENNTPLRPGDLLTDLGELVSAHCAAASPGSGPTEADTARLEATAAARVARLRPEVETSAHRLVQEALTNVRRHAPDAHTIVRLDADTERLRVTVTNTPPHRRALTPAGGRGGFGLLGLQERIEALDGTLRAGPLPGGGWEVSAALPLAPS